MTSPPASAVEQSLALKSLRPARGWMIERLDGDDGPEWWTGTAFNLKEPGAWTKSPTNGIVFADNIGATVVRMALARYTWSYPERTKMFATITTTEHEWP